MTDKKNVDEKVFILNYVFDHYSDSDITMEDKDEVEKVRDYLIKLLTQ